MNIPWKTSDQQSQALAVTGGSPVPTADYTAISAAIDVRGFDWVEFTVSLTGNSGGDPVGTLFAIIEYGEAAGPLAGTWYPATIELVGDTGLAPQLPWNPSIDVVGATASWRIPAPVLGQQMRIKLKGDGTPAGGSTLTVHAYRRSF